MTTMPRELEALKPGTTEARESQNQTGLTFEGEFTQTKELSSLQFPSVEGRGEYQPGKINEVATSLGSAAPEEIQIGSLLDSRLRMRSPLSLEMEQEGEFYIAKCKEFNEFGYGTDPIAAVQDIRNTIAELYWQLKENQDRLGTDLAKTWQVLSELVYEA